MQTQNYNRFGHFEEHRSYNKKGKSRSHNVFQLFPTVGAVDLQLYPTLGAVDLHVYPTVGAVDLQLYITLGKSISINTLQ